MAKDPAELMARIVYADLNVEVEPLSLRMMIRKRWERLAPLAHAVHDEPDGTKAPVGPVRVVDTDEPKVKPRVLAAQKLRDLAFDWQVMGLHTQAISVREVADILEKKD